MSTIDQEKIDNIETYVELEHAKIHYHTEQPIAIVEATSGYIPIEEFKEIFNKTGDLVKEKNIEKLIFDKRKLTVFHQPSMEWYFTDWKESMWDLGLKSHRKILPDNKVFQQSVKIGREKIAEDHPNLKFHQMDIQYKDSIQDAIDN